MNNGTPFLGFIRTPRSGEGPDSGPLFVVESRLNNLWPDHIDKRHLKYTEADRDLVVDDLSR
jgi:hypothetical protein